MKKNVLIVGHAFIIEANRGVWSLLSKKDNISVDLIVPAHWNSNLVGDISYTASKEENDAFKVLPLSVYNKGNGSTYFYHLFELYRVLKKKKYDFILINQEGWSLSLLFFNLTNFFTQNSKSRVFLMIAQNIFKPELKWSWPLERFNFRFVFSALGCCAETEDVLRKKSVKTDWKYFPLFFNKNLWKKEIDKAPPKGVIRYGYIGRISEDKGIRNLTEVFTKLKREEDVELHMAGAGPLSQIAKKTATKYYGVLAHHDVANFYNEVDIIVIPSVTTKAWKEQFGRVIVEAIAAGKMVVGSNSGAIPEVMGELELDYIFIEEDRESLLSVMKRVRADFGSDAFNEKLARARSLCMQKFSEEAFVERLLNYAN